MSGTVKGLSAVEMINIVTLKSRNIFVLNLKCLGYIVLKTQISEEILPLNTLNHENVISVWNSFNFTMKLQSPSQYLSCHIKTALELIQDKQTISWF